MSTIEVEAPRRPSRWGASTVLLAIAVAIGIFIFDGLARRRATTHRGTMIRETTQPMQPASAR